MLAVPLPAFGLRGGQTVVLEDDVISGYAPGVQVGGGLGGSGTVFLSNNTITKNSTGVAVTTGTAFTRSNNTIIANTTNVSGSLTPFATLIVGCPSDKGQGSVKGVVRPWWCVSTAWFAREIEDQDSGNLTCHEVPFGGNCTAAMDNESLHWKLASTFNPFMRIGFLPRNSRNFLQKGHCVKSFSRKIASSPEAPLEVS